MIRHELTVAAPPTIRPAIGFALAGVLFTSEAGITVRHVPYKGLPNYCVEGWLALVGPAGLPTAIVDRLHAEFTAALATMEVQEALGRHARMTGSPNIQQGPNKEASR